MDNIWHKQYQQGIPAEIPALPFHSLLDFFNHACDKYADNIAFVHLGYELSYKMVDKLSTRLAAYMQKLGLKKGDRVAIMLPNTLQYPIAIIACFKAGLSVINTNPLYTPNEIRHQLNDAGVKAIVVLENFALTLEKAQAEIPSLQHVILTNIGDVYPFFKRHLVNGVIRYVKKMIPKHQLKNVISWRKTTHHRHDLIPVESSLEDIAFIQYTGGTTGVSKGAVLSHRNMLSNIMQAATWIKPRGFGEADRIVTALPLYHVFSLTANLLTFFYFGSRNMLITNPNDLKMFIKAMSNYKLTAITGVNTLFNVLLHHHDFQKIDFSALKLTLSGGMALQESVARSWCEQTKSPIVEAYGLTETSPAVCINPVYVDGYNGSVGLPLPSTEISIRDEKGNELSIGEEGEICVRGPQVMREYWQHPEETAKVFYADGFLKTGDIAFMRDDGFVFLVDRKKDLIIVSGFNVYPNEVEQVIGMIPGVLEVGVVGVKIDAGSEKVKACVVKTDPNLTAEDIRQHCKNYLTAYKVPKIIEFYDTLPKTNVGKILRRSLR